MLTEAAIISFLYYLQNLHLQDMADNESDDIAEEDEDTKKQEETASKEFASKDNADESGSIKKTEDCCAKNCKPKEIIAHCCKSKIPKAQQNPNVYMSPKGVLKMKSENCCIANKPKIEEDEELEVKEEQPIYRKRKGITQRADCCRPNETFEEEKSIDETLDKPPTEITEGENIEETETAKAENTEETPAEETPAEEIPAEETPAEETPAEETPAEETPAEETLAEETPAEETPAETDNEEEDKEEDDEEKKEK